MRRPINEPYSISTEFNVPDNAARFGRHAGVDYAVPSGREVFAPVSGLVTDYIWGDYHGHVVQIRTTDGLYHRLMHNSRLLVKPGDWVNEGQLVARSGATGQGVTGAHVHWDISPSKIPTSFDFISPASLLFGMPRAEAPQAVVAAASNLAGRVVWLHPVPEWSVYGVDQQPIRSQRKGVIKPANFDSGLPAPRDRGLTYTIVRNGKYPNTVVINTGVHGQVSIYLDEDATIL